MSILYILMSQNLCCNVSNMQGVKK